MAVPPAGQLGRRWALRTPTLISENTGGIPDAGCGPCLAAWEPCPAGWGVMGGLRWIYQSRGSTEAGHRGHLMYRGWPCGNIPGRGWTLETQVV